MLPKNYYRISFCQPDGGPTLDRENLGELLAGDLIQSSPYQLNMLVDKSCEQLCVTNLGCREQEGISPNRAVQAIRKKYHHNWIVDNLPAASKWQNDYSITTRSLGGFPVGYVDKTNNKSYVYNHVNIEIMYHPVETDPNRYHIVRFTIKPFSIHHQFDLARDSDDMIGHNYRCTNTQQISSNVSIYNPLPSCSKINGNMTNLSQTVPIHTEYEMNLNFGHGPQLASGYVLFTYDVIWVENRELKWLNRWDFYSSMDGILPPGIHYKALYSAFVIVIVLIFRVFAIIKQNVRSGFDQYSQLNSTDKNAEDFEEFGWKLLHAHVFHPPSFSPLLFSWACGTGAQILAAALITLMLSAMGLLSVSNRGILRLAQLGSYLAMGGVGGYVTARLSRTFQGSSWIHAAICTTFGFPGMVFLLFFGMTVFALYKKTTYAVVLPHMGWLLVVWFGISIPLVFSGAYFGYKHGAIAFPVETSLSHYEIPKQPWFLCMPLIVLIGGVLPFGICFVELYFIIQTIWIDRYNDAPGTLFGIFLLLLPICGAIAILSSHLQLGEGNYCWWWRSFWVAGSTAMYFYFYSCFDFLFFSHQPTHSVFSILFYFGYMGVIFFGFFLMTGFVGVAGSWYFHHVLYSSLKID